MKGKALSQENQSYLKDGLTCIKQESTKQLSPNVTSQENSSDHGLTDDEEFEIIDDLFYMLKHLDLENRVMRYFHACALHIWFKEGPDGVAKYWEDI